ncbi:hypothetical protein [Bacillus sp. OAE603]|uniref:hypothetical protein n=1 Tax=Gottfriedia sp. OAE603 TaxID=2663872 RepID=UPI00178A15BA
MSFLFNYFILKAVICLIFKVGLFFIAYFISHYFQFKDAKKMRNALSYDKGNQNFLKHIFKIIIVIVVEYIVSALICYYFDLDFTSTAPFVGLFILIALLLFKFAPSETGEVSPDAGGWFV